LTPSGVSVTRQKYLGTIHLAVTRFPAAATVSLALIGGNGQGPLSRPSQLSRPWRRIRCAGLRAAATGYAPTFLVTGATMLPALAMARREAAPQLDPSSAAAPVLGSEPVPA
jgi:hypothetical protein